MLLPHDAPSLVIRRSAYEQAGLVRHAIDERLGLTSDEFRVEGGLVVIGPIYDEQALEHLLLQFDELGLRHFEDYFDFSGTWPAWLQLSVSVTASAPGEVPDSEPA
jgi:hypothetical protein